MSIPVVLITGGLTGIGRAASVAFAKNGAKVVVAGRRDGAGEALVKELRSFGSQAEFVNADVRKEDDVRALVDKTVALFGRLDVAVNNAGTDVYVANQLDSTISGYSVASNGTLTALADSPYTGGSSVDALAVDRTGDYLLAVARGGTPDLAMYSFDSGIAGKLDLSTTTATGIDPTGATALAATH